MFIKTACCFPERITTKDYDSVLVELLDSEKVIKRKLFTLYTLHSVQVGVSNTQKEAAYTTYIDQNESEWILDKFLDKFRIFWNMEIRFQIYIYEI